jgi:GNAT superfamily N-acetyltransferase
METRLLRPDDTQAALRLLNKDPATNLYQIDVLLRNPVHSFDHYEWRGAFDLGQLVALSLSTSRSKTNQPSALCVPFGDLKGCELLGMAEAKAGGTLNLLGPKAASDALYNGLGRPKASTWRDEKLYVCRTTNINDPYLVVRPAAEDELDVIEPMVTEMQIEDLGNNPRGDNIEQHRKLILRQIKYNRIWVVDVDGQIAFTVNIGTLSPYGCQIGGIYVPPKMRNRGIATRAMRGLNLHFLRRSAIITLLVRHDNTAAIHAYTKAQYTHHSDFRLAELTL